MPLIALPPYAKLRDYETAIRLAGGEPRRLEIGRDDPDEVIRSVDAVLLPGGGDVEPSYYGEARHPTFDAAEAGRDELEIALAQRAREVDMPVLAICRGLQLLNVHLGGTLHQHLAAHPVGGDGVHEVRFAAGSVLRGLYGPRCPVNSLHHQAVATAGTGLTCVGHAPDGVVEAVELTGRPVLGVQWHPEQLTRPDPVFTWLVSAAASRETG